MPVITYTSVCTSKADIARGVVELRFAKPDGFTFKPGQFVLFDVPLVGSASSGRGGAVEATQTRALSIASATEEPDLLFIVKLLPGGRLSRWITEVLKEKSSVTFKGPFGNFVLTPPPPDPLPPSSFAKASEDKAVERGRDLFFIATGAGLAPFRPMVLSALTPDPSPAGAGEGRPRIDILFGVRAEEDLFWKEWLEEASKKYENVFSHIALSQGSPSWTGHRGRVQAIAPQLVNNDFTNKTLYVCGNPDMTTDVKRLALTEWGVDKKDLHVEGYI